jgi:hypothetical protein
MKARTIATIAFLLTLSTAHARDLVCMPDFNKGLKCHVTTSNATPKPEPLGCYQHCNPDGYGGTVCHWNCY